MLIYQLTNKLNGKSYIGQTVQTLEHRVRGHRTHKRRSAIGNAVKKYGIESFDQRILLYAGSHEELDYYEEQLIARLNTQRPNGYNIKLGGNVHRGMAHTPEAIEKIRQASTGRLHSEATKQKISQTRIEKGFRHTPEVLAQISAKMKGRVGTFKGKTHSIATKQKISESGLGRKHSSEDKQKISEASKEMWQTRSRQVPYKARPSMRGRTAWNKGKTGFHHTSETKQKISEASTKMWAIRKSASMSDLN